MGVRVVCAWCGKLISEPHEPIPGIHRDNLSTCFLVPTSHGICPACFAEQEAVLTGMAPAPAHPGKVGGEG